MTVTSGMVLRDAGAGDADNDVALEVLAEATAYVDAYVAANLVDPLVTVPTAIQDAAVLACATDLFARRKAPFGQQIMTDTSGNPVPTRLGMDPLAGARAKLQPWCASAGFAFPEDWDDDA